ncbi:PREDICTED: uncharacterized protein LOC101368211 [Odobenus rosmarus divergens]|uniref:Uncharacterized protein LOC101368211 n=1 Tax=Odobenus rosmarus divergens TaxID=9708 RepID=A0A9B0GBS1_ODORO
MSRALIPVRVIASSLNEELNSPQAGRKNPTTLTVPLTLRPTPQPPSGCGPRSLPHLSRVRGPPHRAPAYSVQKRQLPGASKLGARGRCSRLTRGTEPRAKRALWKPADLKARWSSELVAARLRGARLCCGRCFSEGNVYGKGQILRTGPGPGQSPEKAFEVKRIAAAPRKARFCL